MRRKKRNDPHIRRHNQLHTRTTNSVLRKNGRARWNLIIPLIRLITHPTIPHSTASALFSQARTRARISLAAATRVCVRKNEKREAREPVTISRRAVAHLCNFFSCLPRAGTTRREKEPVEREAGEEEAARACVYWTATSSSSFFCKWALRNGSLARALYVHTYREKEAQYSAPAVAPGRLSRYILPSRRERTSCRRITQALSVYVCMCSTFTARARATLSRAMRARDFHSCAREAAERMYKRLYSNPYLASRLIVPAYVYTDRCIYVYVCARRAIRSGKYVCLFCRRR